MINHSGCNAQRPSLKLELDGAFSPLMHMNMQSELVHKLAKRFSSPAKIITHSEVMEYKGMIDEWMLNFPPIFALVNPDTSHDRKHTWIEYHRHYNYTMGYMMILNPFRRHMGRPYTAAASEEQLELRRIAVNLALRIIDVLDNWLTFLTFRDGRFHFIIFSLLDAATVLSNMVLNDKAGTVPRRDDIYRAVKNALMLQKKLLRLSESAKKGFRLMQRILRDLIRATPQEYLDYLNGNCDDGNHLQALRAASGQVSDGALMSVQHIDGEVPLGPGIWNQPVAEAPAQAFDAEAGSQPAAGVAPVAFDYSNSAAVPYNSMGYVVQPTLSEYQTAMSSQVASAIAASSDYSEPTIPNNTSTAPLEYTSSTSLYYVPPTFPNFGAATPQNRVVVTPAYAESALPTHVSVISPNYVAAAPPTYIAATFSDYATSASSNNVSSYVEPVFSDHASSASLGYVAATSSNHVADYTADYAGGTFPDYTATDMPYYVEPAPLSTYNTSATSEYIAATSVNDTGLIPGFAPQFIPDPTIYDTSAPHITSTFYNDVELYTTSESYYPTAVYDIPVPYNALATYATPASYTSPESYTSSESHNLPPTVYDTSVSYTASATYATSSSYKSPEANTSPENHGASEVYTYTATAAAATVLPITGVDDSNYAASTSYEAPESYCPPPTDFAPPNNSTSNQM